MANYREILRLSSLGFNHTQIAKSADCSRTTVINVLQLAKEKELKYPLPKDMSDKALYEALRSTRCRIMSMCTRSFSATV